VSRRAFIITIPGEKRGDIYFWHGFLPYFSGNDLDVILNTRNLAYIALLAGWLCFSYWLYVDGIVPRLHSVQETSWPEYSETLPYSLAFTWGSDDPLAGNGFGALKAEVERMDSLDEILVVKGYYFRDEMDDEFQLQQLGHRRIDHVLDYMDIDQRRVVRLVDAQAVNGDVRANPFEAVWFERLKMPTLMTIGKDTIELCFPLKDSLHMPSILVDQLINWMGKPSKHESDVMHITGTADGSGVAESSEIALERALYISDILLNDGWEKDQIQISSGQRNHPLALRNRCVIVYFE